MSAESETPDEATPAQEREQAEEQADQTMRDLEQGEAPTDPADWPSGAAKYRTYGVDEDEAYGDGLTAKLGPSDVRRFADGSITIKGEQVENPDEHRGEPIAGGPTDENRTKLPWEERMEAKGKEQEAAGEDEADEDPTEAAKKKDEAAFQTMKDLESGDAPKDPADWPSDSAKYKTFGVDEDEPYGEGLTAKLGPSDLRRFEDGSITIKGEQVENPDDHRGEPIPGGPTDPNSAKLAGEDRDEDRD